MMKKAEKIAKAARKKRDRRAEAKHSRDSRGPKTVTKHLNSKAPKIIFKERNRRRNLGRIDFHGLPVREALKCANQELQSTIQKPNKVMHFIVGKGSHSVDGRPKIRPAVKRLCEKQGFQAFQDPKNSGVLIVQRPKSPVLVQGHRTF
ncbi:hypothetical protein BC826DRAFT_106456 [Russula brevipes]|nr:hypothetical protein BC826DRAFT_106456 [Russula brevipes]